MKIRFSPDLRRYLLPASAIAALCVLAGCGDGTPAESGDAKASRQEPKESSGGVPPPDLTVPAAKPVQLPPFLFVKTAFQSESEYGTHEFPVGAKVAVLEKRGDSYLVEMNGVSVLNGAEFFSETMIVKDPVPTPSPSPSPSPVLASDADYIAVPTPAPGSSVASVPEPSPTPASTPEPSPVEPDPVARAEEDRKVEEISAKIREIDDKISRSSVPGASDAPSSQEVKKLRKQRDNLGEELSTLTKP